MIYSFVERKKMSEIKIFQKYLSNDLQLLSEYLVSIYNQLGEIYVPDDEWDKFTESKSVSTIMWREYNIFQFYDSQIYNIFNGLKELVKEACEYHKIDYYEKKYWVQGWFNINSGGGDNGKLGWHTHAPDQKSIDGSWHGYYGVNIEPSSTFYKSIDNNTHLEHRNENNKMILSSSIHEHAMGNWNWDGLRISIAYDVTPQERMSIASWDKAQHWIPLGL